MLRFLTTASILISLPAFLTLFSPARQASSEEAPPRLELFFETVDSDQKVAESALNNLAQTWHDGYTPMILDLIAVISASRTANPRRERLFNFLENRTEQTFGKDSNAWRRWAWSLPYEPHPNYAAFKGILYGAIDPKMKEFFPPGVQSSIRLDQVEWGGVKVNGIPPLVDPEVISAADADYLADSDLVFGIEIEGIPRAYPKKIVGWHELVRDRLGETRVTLVYCTLCGAAVPYQAELQGVPLTFGTSGLLYQSNKLLFDAETGSVWSTLQGRPVVGRLVNSGLELKMIPVVTVRWGQWRTMHPDTTALSPDTGFERDYSEGSAYREYFATDDLMFPVARKDDRMKNKEEVLALRLRTGPDEDLPIALSLELLERDRIVHFEVAGVNLVAISEEGGAHRVFQTAGVTLESREPDKAGRFLDSTGTVWELTESALLSEENPEHQLLRVPAHQVFWFAWYAQFPETRLIQ